MAKLVKSIEIQTDYTDYAGDWDRGVAKFKAHARRNITDDNSIVGEIVKFQVADGYATYGIIKEKPLQLCFIGSGDFYSIPDAHIRGLNLSDVRQLVQRERAIAEMFANR